VVKAVSANVAREIVTDMAYVAPVVYVPVSVDTQVRRAKIRLVQETDQMVSNAVGMDNATMACAIAPDFMIHRSQKSPDGVVATATCKRAPVESTMEKIN
jgi:hypothetical protein